MSAARTRARKDRRSVEFVNWWLASEPRSFAQAVDQEVIARHEARTEHIFDRQRFNPFPHIIQHAGDLGAA